MKTMLFVLATLIYVLYALAPSIHAQDISEYLFVQTALGATLKGTLTMTGVAINTSYFADRPVRVAGTMPTDVFLLSFVQSRIFAGVRMQPIHFFCVYVVP